MRKQIDATQRMPINMSHDWHNLFASLRSEPAPVFDVRQAVLQQIAQTPSRPADEPLLRWLMVVAVTAASLVWAAVLPNLGKSNEPHVSYVALIESLDVSTEYYSAR